MKRKLLFAIVALLCSIGASAQYAVSDLVSAGWTNVTASSITGTNDNYYILVDAQSSNYVMSCEADHYRPCYKTIADPVTHPSFVWVLDGSDNNFSLKNYATGAYFKQSSGWNTSVGDGRNGSVVTAQFTLNSGKYDIKCVESSGMVGHWNDGTAGVESEGENIAANKSAEHADGFFLYAISKTTYDAAILAAREATATGASESSPVDVTTWIQNADWSGDWGGWEFSCTSSGNIQWGQKTIESWNANGVVVKQELRGVPNGKYKVQADLISGNSDNKVAYVFGTGSAKVSSSAVSAVASAGDYTTMSNEVAGNTLTADNIVVTGNTITIGIDQAAGWIVADNFKLYYLGEDLSIYVDAYNDALTAAEAVDQSAPMNATVLTALQTAISTYDSVDTSDKDALLAATTALGTATSNATASIAAYAPMASAITDIDDVILAAATSATVAATDYNAIKTAFTNGTIANGDIAGKIIEAYDAIIPVIKSQTDATADFTYAIQNHSFEYGNMTGWTVTNSSDTGVRETSNATYAATGSDGKYLFNTWWKGNPITQSITGLPNGEYTMTVSVSSDGATIYLIANGDHDSGTESGGTYPSNDTFQEASFTFLVTDGTATIGVVGGANGTAGEHKAYQEDGYWWYKADNFRLVKNRNLNVEETKTILEAEIATANATYNSGANVGTGVFQIPAAAGTTFTGAIATAQVVYENGSATVSDVETAIENLKAAETTYANAELNAPAADKRYCIKVATAGHAKLGNAIVLDRTAEYPVYSGKYITNNTGFTLNASAVPAEYLAQACQFTAVDGKVNTYYISMERTEGTVYLTYGKLNDSKVNWKDAQIQATTESSKKGEFRIAAVSTANVFNIVNTNNDELIGCEDGGNIYTTNNNGNFTLAEASQASVAMGIKAGKFGTRIFPFTPSLPTGVVAYSCAAHNGASLTLEEVASPQANVPYILKNTTASDVTEALTGWGTASTANPDAAGYLTGTYATDVKVPANSYVLQTPTSTGKQGFYQVETDNTITLGQYRAYLTIPADPDPVKAFFLEGDETGIESIEEANFENAKIYNLAGQRVSKATKGLYIVNGKKMLVK